MGLSTRLENAVPGLEVELDYGRKAKVVMVEIDTCKAAIMLSNGLWYNQNGECIHWGLQGGSRIVACETPWGNSLERGLEQARNREFVSAPDWEEDSLLTVKWPQPITHRRPNKKDADPNGYVQVFSDDDKIWYCDHWFSRFIGEKGWQRSPSWVEPEPTPEEIREARVRKVVENLKIARGFLDDAFDSDRPVSQSTITEVINLLTEPQILTNSTTTNE